MTYTLKGDIMKAFIKRSIPVIFLLLIIIKIVNNSKIKEYLLESLMNSITNKPPLVLSKVSSYITPRKLLNIKVKDEELIDPIGGFVYLEEEKEDNPIMYIYNTHQTEEYERTSFHYSIKPTVMIASAILKEHLKKYGIESIIETNSIKEYLNRNNLNYNDSYHASENYARTALINNPSIKYMIDIHRDSAKKDITLINIDNKPYAKLMFLMGYEHTKEENNINFAPRLYEIIESKYKGLTRGVVDRRSPYKGSYNPDLDAISTLIEVGGVDSNLEEINNSLEVLAWAINEYIKEKQNG